jgi:adenosine kinase
MKTTGKDKQGLLGMTRTIITTLGEKGSLISTSEGERTVPAASIAAIVDPTGAGDAYRAGLLKGLALSKDIETAAKMGAVVAAYAVENYGTQEHSYTYEEFTVRYKSNFGEL